MTLTGRLGSFTLSPCRDEIIYASRQPFLLWPANFNYAELLTQGHGRGQLESGPPFAARRDARPTRFAALSSNVAFITQNFLSI